MDGQMALTLKQQKEMLSLLKWAKHACWDRDARKFSSIALNIDDFYETIAHDEVAQGLEWEYIEPRKPKTEIIVEDDIFS